MPLFLSLLDYEKFLLIDNSLDLSTNPFHLAAGDHKKIHLEEQDQEKYIDPTYFIHTVLVRDRNGTVHALSVILHNKVSLSTDLIPLSILIKGVRVGLVRLKSVAENDQEVNMDEN